MNEFFFFSYFCSSAADMVLMLALSSFGYCDSIKCRLRPVSPYQRMCVWRVPRADGYLKQGNIGVRSSIRQTVTLVILYKTTTCTGTSVTLPESSFAFCQASLSEHLH